MHFILYQLYIIVHCHAHFNADPSTSHHHKQVITGFPDTLCRSLCILCLRALLARACPSSSYKVQQFHHTHAIILRISYVRDTSDPLKLVRLPSFHTMSKSFVPDINPARRSCCRCPNPSCLILIPHEGPVVTSPSFTYVQQCWLNQLY